MRALGTPDQFGYLYITQNLRSPSANKDSNLGEQLGKLREDSARQVNIYDYGGVEVALYYGKTPYLAIDPDTLAIVKARILWNHSYLLGTDVPGRDILTRPMYGTRVSLLVAFAMAEVNLILGTVYNGISSYFDGRVDMAAIRVVDIISMIPLTLCVTLITVLMDVELQNIMVTSRTTYWVDMAHVVKG